MSYKDKNGRVILKITKNGEGKTGFPVVDAGMRQFNKQVICILGIE